MKSHLSPAIKLTLVCILVFVGAYTFFVWGMGQVIAPNNGKGEIIYYKEQGKGQPYGFANIGQSFTANKYFWSRPSAVGYNAAGSGASNKGPTNPEYLAQVQARIDTILAHNPTLKKSDIPVELVTASGSGLDPHISPEAAMIQIARISVERNLRYEQIAELVKENTEKPLFNLLGPSRVNVLKLNIALDNTR